MEGQSRISVVDDNRVTVLIIKKVLENGLSNSYIIDIYGNGLEAYDGYNRMENGEDLKLVVTDLNMPKMDGLGLIKGLRESGYKKHIILNSSDGHKYLGREEELGIDVIVTKPDESTPDPRSVLQAAKELLQE